MVNAKADFQNGFSNTITRVVYTIPKIIVNILYIILLFFLINGLFTVSAGANKIKQSNEINAIAINNWFGNITYLHNKGIPTKVGREVIQHIHDFAACNPKPVVLSTLNNNRTIMVSMKKPKMIDNSNITTNFVVER